MWLLRKLLTAFKDLNVISLYNITRPLHVVYTLGTKHLVLHAYSDPKGICDELRELCHQTHPAYSL
jgi:hypothetical protein